ncbi:zinc finger protein OZF-like [Octopus sinensis]|uniref:Zinc finger protein OZF-like n=1 Tax=Octopus sinensis TaxID=2607531 RepID=A0A7E6FA92_9MOLL|nr:zinc finger protein OZF-like [Octopus sinensis]XP_036364672.1 zinc finger protein OZF-like [Octopus sinensis]XP_036364673.1 zinc finger protein OZF-like [Octopus sinensis]
MNHMINTSNFELSEAIHNMERSHSCDICGKGFTRYDNLERHRLSHRVDKPFRCDTCGKSFSQKSHLKQHKVIHTGVKPFKCHLCGSAFSQNGNLTRHMKTHGIAPTISTQHHDNQSETYMHTHSQIYANDKPFKCNVCGAAFSRNGDLTRHFRTHEESLLPQNNPNFNSGYGSSSGSGGNSSGGRGGGGGSGGDGGGGGGSSGGGNPGFSSSYNNNDNPFNCRACWKAFTERTDAGLHERIHAALLPYRCELCGKAFAENSYLTRHKRAHTREKLFNCEVCNKSFSQKSHLKVHHRIHTGERPFRCGLCGYAFARKDHLERHQRNNKNGGKLSCVPRQQHATSATTVATTVPANDSGQQVSSNAGGTISVSQQTTSHEVQPQQDADVPHYMNI